MAFTTDEQRRAAFGRMGGKGNRISIKPKRMSYSSKPRGISWVDTETTGVARKDRILEIAIVKKDGKHTQTFSTLVKPPVRINPMAQRVHSISYNDVKDAPPFFKIKHKVDSLLKGSKEIIGHNHFFDTNMLAKEGIHVPKEKMIDTIKMARDGGLKTGPNGRLTLDGLASQLKVKKNIKRHSALGDVLLTAECYERMIKKKGKFPYSGKRIVRGMSTKGVDNISKEL